MVHKFDIQTKKQHQIDDFDEQREESLKRFKQYAQEVYDRDITIAKQEMEDQQKRNR